MTSAQNTGLHMNRNDYEFASVDTNQYIDALAVLIKDHVKRGFKAYMLTFMFRSLPMSERASKQAMINEVMRVYGRFLTATVRYPWSKRNTNNRPIFIGCPDWPVPKAIKHKLYTDAQSGIHFAGILLVPPITRLSTSVMRHFKAKRDTYIRSPGALARIHLKRVKHGIDRTTAYSFKAIKRRKCYVDDILVLPMARSERSAA
jgi:hypothetical protein